MKCPRCGTRVMATVGRHRSQIDQPDFADARWECSCGWIEPHDEQVDHGGPHARPAD